jgi:ribosome-associated protein
MENLDKQFMKPKEYKIPEDEIRFEFARSGGPGGQNVNKRDTRVTALWCIGASKIFSDEQKQKIREMWPKRVNKNDELWVDVSEERSQPQNRRIAIERLNNLVNSALIPQKERIPTKPTKSSVEKRIEEKKRVGEKKRMREKIRF